MTTLQKRAALQKIAEAEAARIVAPIQKSIDDINAELKKYFDQPAPSHLEIAHYKRDAIAKGLPGADMISYQTLSKSTPTQFSALVHELSKLQ